MTATTNDESIAARSLADSHRDVVNMSTTSHLSFGREDTDGNTLFARAAAKRMMHYVPCTAPICSPLATAVAVAAASGAAQFILRIRAGYVRYIRVLRKSVPPGRSIPHVRGIEPRLLSRPRLCTHCAHVNGHIDTGAWRKYRERACPAPHRRRPATTDRRGASLLPSPSRLLSLPISLPSLLYVFFSIRYPAFVTTRSVS